MFSWWFNPTTQDIQQQSNPKLKVVTIENIEVKQQNCIRIVCISDTHGITKPEEIPDGDILIHCGDFSMLGTVKELNCFHSFLESLPHKHKVIISGNHDLGMDYSKYDNLKIYWPKNKDDFTYEKYVEICKLFEKYIYLENSSVTLFGYKIWGSPFTTGLTGFAFSEKEKVLAEKYSKISDDTDIIVTHGPPHSIGDYTVYKKHIGSTSLLEKTNSLPNLKYIIFGHNHEGYGHYMLEGKHFINCALVDQNYNPCHKPIIIDLPIK